MRPWVSYGAAWEVTAAVRRGLAPTGFNDKVNRLGVIVNLPFINALALSHPALRP